MRSLAIALGACAIIGCGRIPIGDWDVPSQTGGARQETSVAGTSNGGAGGSEPTGPGGRTTSLGSSGAFANTSGAAGQSDDGAASGGSVVDAGGRTGSTAGSDAGAIEPQGGAGAAASTAGTPGVGPAGTGAAPATSSGGQDTSQGGDTAGGGVAGDGGGGVAGAAGYGGATGTAGRGGFEDSGGSDTGGGSTGGSSTGASSTGGSSTGASSTGGSSTGGSDTGGTPPIPPPVAAWEPCSEDSAITVVAANAEQGCWVGCTDGDVFYGECDGASWVRTDDPATSAPLPDLPVSTIVPLYNDSLRAYVSFVGLPSVRKIWETQTQGQTWLEHWESSVLDVWSLSYVPVATDHLYAYVVAPDGAGSHIDASNDGGSTYYERYVADALIGLPSGATDLVSTITMYDFDPDRFIVGTINGNLYVTSNGTTERTWGRIGPVGMPRYPVTKIALRPYESSYELWATFEGPLKYGVWVSTGGTLNWDNAHAPGLPDGAGSSVVDGWYGVSFNPVFPDTLYLFGTEGAYRTDDHGATWTHTWPRQQ
ncbi:MAG: hypothetical protein JW940_26765 [Polyangiaceae bacterium]|nr:hypothetical protein [Polyangiaceae bacterium]